MEKCPSSNANTAQIYLKKKKRQGFNRMIMLACKLLCQIFTTEDCNILK